MKKEILIKELFLQGVSAQKIARCIGVSKYSIERQVRRLENQSRDTWVFQILERGNAEEIKDLQELWPQKPNPMSPEAFKKLHEGYGRV